jgi:hypothetical protein
MTVALPGTVNKSEDYYRIESGMRLGGVLDSISLARRKRNIAQKHLVFERCQTPESREMYIFTDNYCEKPYFSW